MADHTNWSGIRMRLVVASVSFGKPRSFVKMTSVILACIETAAFPTITSVKNRYIFLFLKMSTKIFKVKPMVGFGSSKSSFSFGSFGVGGPVVDSEFVDESISWISLSKETTSAFVRLKGLFFAGDSDLFLCLEEVEF